MYLGLDKIGLEFWKFAGRDDGEPYKPEDLQNISSLDSNARKLVQPQVFVEWVKKDGAAEDREGDFGLSYKTVCKVAQKASSITDISIVQVFLTDGQKRVVVATYKKGSPYSCINKNKKDLPSFVEKYDGYTDALKYMYKAMKAKIKQDKGSNIDLSEVVNYYYKLEKSIMFDSGAPEGGTAKRGDELALKVPKAKDAFKFTGWEIRWADGTTENIAYNKGTEQKVKLEANNKTSDDVVIYCKAAGSGAGEAETQGEAEGNQEQGGAADGNETGKPKKPKKPTEQKEKEIVLQDGLNLVSGVRGKTGDGRSIKAISISDNEDVAKILARGRSLASKNTIAVILQKTGDEVKKICRYVAGQEEPGATDFDKTKILESLGFDE